MRTPHVEPQKSLIALRWISKSMPRTRRPLDVANLALICGAGLFALFGLSGFGPALIVALVCIGLLAFTAPLARWGRAGLLLTPGLLLVLLGTAALVAGSVGGVLASELNEDNDRDGRVNEDPPGDADGSASDPTQVGGVAEARQHADDDSDGRIDEDPATPPGTRTALAAAGSLGLVLTALGVVAIAAFLVWRRRAAVAPPSAAGPDAPAL